MSCSQCGQKASWQIVAHKECRGVHNLGICQACVTSSWQVDGDPWRILCPHCNEPAVVSETAAFKRLRRSTGVARSDWDILEIPEGSSKRDIAKAYRRKAGQCHPDKDKSEGASERFLQLTEAHDRLISDHQELQHLTLEQGERAKALRRILSDVERSEWPARLQREHALTLRALQALLEGRTPRVNGVHPALCDDQPEEKPKSVMHKGLIAQKRRGRQFYQNRMSHQGLVVETEPCHDLDEALRMRSEIVRLKGEGGQCEDKEHAWRAFGDANGVCLFKSEAGNGSRKTTPQTVDIERAVQYGKRLREAAAHGKDEIVKVQKEQRQELKAVRRAAADAESDLLQMVKLAVHPPRRLRGKQAPPPVWQVALALANPAPPPAASRRSTPARRDQPNVQPAEPAERVEPAPKPRSKRARRSLLPEWLPLPGFGWGWS